MSRASVKGENLCVVLQWTKDANRVSLLRIMFDAFENLQGKTKQTKKKRGKKIM